MQALLQRGEVDPAFPAEDEYTVDDKLDVELAEGGDDLGKVPGERSLLARFQGDAVVTAVGDAAEAVQFRFRWPPGLVWIIRSCSSSSRPLDQALGAAHGVDVTGGWGLAKLPVVSDSGYGDVTEFRLGLDERGLPYVVAVKPTTSAYPADAVPTTPPYGGRGGPPVPRYRDEPTNLVALRIRPANRDIPRLPDRNLPECWLLAEWAPGEPEPTDYWLSTLPAGTPLRELVRLAKIRWRIEHDYREFKDGLGLDHFEGAATSDGTATSP